MAEKKTWKGKEWIPVLAPSLFKHTIIGETAATDPATIIGRTVETDGSELTGSPAKDRYKLFFKITSLDGKTAHTTFHALYVGREWLARFVRKRTQKVECVVDGQTKDGWQLHTKCLLVLNKSYTQIERKVRARATTLMKETITGTTMDDLLNSILDGAVQKTIRKDCSKIYPVVFTEIAKVEVVGKLNK